MSNFNTEHWYVSEADDRENESSERSGGKGLIQTETASQFDDDGDDLGLNSQFYSISHPLVVKDVST